MGKINQGVLGGFSGKVGNVVGGSWKGIDYMRIKPANVANPRTEGQVNQRTKFTTVLEFLQSMKDFIKVGFKSSAHQMTEFNAAMSYNLKNGVTGIAPNFTIDYASALVSKGGLPGAINTTVQAGANPGEIDLTWGDNSAVGSASADDPSLILLYNPDKMESVFTTAGPTRSTGAYTVIVPDSFTGDSLEAYIAFGAVDGTAVSNSAHIGSVVTP